MPLQLYLLNIPKVSEGFLKKVIPKLPSPLQTKISRLRFVEQQWRVILSDLLMRKVLSEEIQTTPHAIKIETDAYGKPFLKEKEREFNLSHARDYIFFATDDTPLGVDIEYVQPLNDFRNLVQTCLSAAEQQACFSQGEKKQIDYFYELWTLKESYVKALGKGLTHSPKSFSIKILGEDIFLDEPACSEHPWHFKKYAFVDEYKAAVCAQHRNFIENPILVLAFDLLELIQ